MNQKLKTNNPFMKRNYLLWNLIFLFILFVSSTTEGQISITNRSADSLVVFSKDKLLLTHDYKGKHNISKLDNNKQNVISGIFSKQRLARENIYSIQQTLKQVLINVLFPGNSKEVIR